MVAGFGQASSTSWLPRRSGEVVSATLHDSRVPKLSFPGSTEVARTLLAEAADQVVNTSMELGWQRLVPGIRRC